jgi:hypothetical protein
MLILPVLQSMAGIFAVFAMIHLARVAFGRLRATESLPAPRRLEKELSYTASYRLVPTRSARAHARPLGLYR